jgi:MFS family permease
VKQSDILNQGHPQPVPHSSTSYAALVSTEPRPLAFGFLHASAATVGQTFVIALFLPSIKAQLGLGDAQVASFFTLTTLGSAVVLWAAGRLVDTIDLLRFSLVCAAVLAGGCALIAFATSVPLFVLGLFALRLGGNGLLSHVALTATARYFTSGRGQALSLVAAGFSFGEAALGLVVVFLIDAWGWRATMVAAGAFGALLVVAAVALVHGSDRFRHPARHGESVAAGSTLRRSRSKSARGSSLLWFTPLFLVLPLIVTALVFHQGVIAHAKGLSLHWFAVSFVAFSATRLASSLLAGPAIDRFGSAGLFALHLLPFSVGVMLLAWAAGAWVVPVYWVLAGVTAGLAGTLQVTVIAERVPAARLGRVRGVLASMTIVAAAAGPALYGALIAAGVAVNTLLWSSAIAMVVATVIGVIDLRQT